MLPGKLADRSAWYWPPLMGLLAIALRLLLLPLVPIPIPTVHDEFSYLLGADTFASGRVTNPPHPMWIHFETFHINFLPTYCSKYPPAQALFLAFGQKVLGHPWFGVCLSIGVMMAAICWMLQGWVAQKYALFTSLLVMLGWGITGPWVNSYWGGAVAAAGGALVIGAIPRLLRGPSGAAALLGASGLVILANSRPFEGLLTAGAAGSIFAWRLYRTQRGRTLGLRTIVPFALVTVSVVAAMGYYNYRTTGSVLVLPYTVNQRTYAASPLFYVFPAVQTPVYRHENLRTFWDDFVLGLYLDARSHPLRTVIHSGRILSDFYLVNPFGLLIAAGILFSWGPEVRAALILLAAPMAGLSLAIGLRPHYLAPAFGALLILGAAGVQRIGRLKTAAAVTMAGVLGLSGGWAALSIQHEYREARKPPAAVAMRPALIHRLQEIGGRHLVIVRYKPDHDVHSEWVYNRASIDASDIVWAQDMGTVGNRELLDYYRGRKVWLLRPDVDPESLTPYPGFS